jgi:hypothetical protein
MTDNIQRALDSLDELAASSRANEPVINEQLQQARSAVSRLEDSLRRMGH